MKKDGSSKSIEITDYTDYVPFMTDLVEHKRQVGHFSYRLFCQRSGFRSPSYLKWVLDGVRTIALRSTHKFADGLSLNKHEAEYFRLMVNYKEATDLPTKRTYYEQMLASRQRRAGSLTKDAYEYLSHWYYVAIRELVGATDFQEDPRWIQEKLGGKLTLWEIKGGLETLSRLNLISRNNKGRWQQTSRDLLTESEVESLAAYNYHSEMLELAKQVLSTQSAKVRDYQSLVALIDEKAFAQLKLKIEEFQKSVVNFLREEERAPGKAHLSQELYAFNTQLLPLVRSGKEDL